MKLPRVQIGDVFEFAHEGLYFYAQYTHDDPLYCEVLQMPTVRFTHQLKTWPPDNVDGITSFCAAIAPMLRDGLCAYVGNYPLTGRFAVHPLMVSGAQEQGARQMIWNGAQLTEPGLNFSLEGLPRRAAIGYPVILRRATSFSIIA